MAAVMEAARGARRRQREEEAKTSQYRNFDRGVNLTDARVDIDDRELAWCENAVPVGKGALQIIPRQGAAIATIAAGITSQWGFNLNIAGTATAIIVTINNDGSATQVNRATGATTAICAAGNLDTDSDVAIFRNSLILFVGRTKGYKSWDGAAFAVIDASKTGISLAVFEGRVWIASPDSRTVVFTAPNSATSFTAGDGAGSFILTDQAFPGNITHMISALEQLWIAGAGAIEAVANVTATGVSPSVVTTFSITNIVTGLGVSAANSMTGYFRSLTFMPSYGVYALSGVSPQKISEKIDGLFPALTLGNAPGAIAVVQSLPVLCFLVTYTQSLAPSLPTPASGATTATKLLLCFTQGRWFFATQGALTWITTVVYNGALEAWGTDGSTVYQLFGDSTTAVAYKIQTKLFDFGLSTVYKSITTLGFEYQSANAITPTVTIDNEITSQSAALSFGNTIVFVNNSGQQLAWVNNVNAPITWVSQGMVLASVAVNMSGYYLGVTISGTDKPYRIQALQLTVVKEGETRAL